MKQLLFLFMVSASLFTACRRTPEETHLKRIVFDPGPLQFIASSLNERAQTMSALYGNSEAHQSLNSAESRLAAGSELKLVTWRYHENPQYYGGRINGELLFIETVHADKKDAVSYHIQEMISQSAVSHAFKDKDRMAYIIGFKPASFP